MKGGAGAHKIKLCAKKERRGHRKSQRFVDKREKRGEREREKKEVETERLG